MGWLRNIKQGKATNYIYAWNFMLTIDVKWTTYLLDEVEDHLIETVAIVDLKDLKKWLCPSLPLSQPFSVAKATLEIALSVSSLVTLYCQSTLSSINFNNQTTLIINQL